LRRELEELKSSRPALGWSHPDWLCGRWLARWGAGPVGRLLEWNNTPPATYARLNTLKIDAQGLARRWEEERVVFESRSFDWIPDGLLFELKSHPPLGTLGSLQEGLFYIQDPSTLLAVAELDPQPGEAVLDLCAAPGGKTTYIAQRMNNQGRLVAQDTNRTRLDRARENCARLGVTCATFSTATTVDFPELSVSFDRILVDAPCSNTGVIRRRVDLRWRIQPAEIERLSTLQVELLRDAAVQLKPGGTLVYSTCSLEPEENQRVTKSFLAAHPEFRLRNERPLTPFEHGVDGAYVARLVKR
jgi:16S rRNA (cytosine967-C5)-methyltransferase